MVVFDSGVLTILLNPDSDVPADPTTQKPIERAKDRVDYLISCLAERHEKILIPTPVLSEILVVSGSSGVGYLNILRKSSEFEIANFDIRAAIELAEITKAALATGDKKSGIDAPWQLIKIDRQIVSIAKTAGAARIYTSDGPLSAFARRAGIEAVLLQDLPLPPENPQYSILDALAPSPDPPAIAEEPDETEIDAVEAIDKAEGQEEEAEGEPDGTVPPLPPGGRGT